MAWTVALLALLAWGTLAFGAVYPWAYVPLIVGSVTVGAVGWRVSGAHYVVRPSGGLIVALVAVAAAASVQVLPFPGSVLSELSPSGDAFFGAESVLGMRTSLSLDPRSTALSVVWLVSLTILFIGCVRWFGSVGMIGTVTGVMVLGVALALVGIVQKATYSGAIYGFWEPRFGTAPFGPFVNENHFAGWMMMSLPIVVGSFSARISRAMREVRVRRDWRNRALWLSSPEANKLLLVAVATMLMGLALVLTFSRAGITCLTIALLLSGWFSYRRQTSGPRRSLGLAYVLLAMVVGIGLTGVDAVAGEFAGTSWTSVFGRLGLWEDGLRIVSDFALTGTGMNTYGTATLLYSTDPGGRVLHAHNDYIQYAAEGGILVGLPLIVAAGFFLRDVVRRFRSGEDDDTTYWIRAGAVTGLVAIALQEVIDFSLQMPGNLVMFTVLCAIAVHYPSNVRRNAQ